MWYYSPRKNKLIYQVRANTYDFWLPGHYGKYNSNIFLLLFKNDALPLNSLFWSPTAVHRFDASDMAVPSLNISCTVLAKDIIIDFYFLLKTFSLILYPEPFYTPYSRPFPWTFLYPLQAMDKAKNVK